VDKLVGFHELFNDSVKYDWGSRDGFRWFLADKWLNHVSGRDDSSLVDKTADTVHAEMWFGSYGGDKSAYYYADGERKHLTDSDINGFMVKLLDVVKPLSIQVHPNRKNAEEGFADNVEGYVDSNHKPEMLVSLSETFTAYVGFRNLSHTIQVLDEIILNCKYRRKSLKILDEFKQKIRNIAETYTGDDTVERKMHALLFHLLNGGGEKYGEALREVLKNKRFATSPMMEVKILHETVKAHPEDNGIALALLLDVRQVGRYETIFIPAGVPHAYVEGRGVEILAASDNVFRAGLTNKPVNAEEFIRNVNVKPNPPHSEPLTEPISVYGDKKYDLVDDFTVLVGARTATTTVPAAPAILVNIDESTVKNGAETLVMPAGSVYYVENVGGFTVKGKLIIAY